MIAAHREPQTLSAELQLPGACIGCNGPLAVRVTTSGAYGCCLHCHTLSSLLLEKQGSELRLVHQGKASA